MPFSCNEKVKLALNELLPIWTLVGIIGALQHMDSEEAITTDDVAGIALDTFSGTVT